MTAKPEPFDPFRLTPLGARPALATYWPDTTFIELSPAAGYLDTLLASVASASDRDGPAAENAKLAVALSVIQHENTHRWVSHIRSWGILRRLIDIVQLDLLGVFLHSLDAATLTRQLRNEHTAEPLLSRAGDLDVVIDPSWTGTTHSAAEHAWVCTILRALVDHGHHRLAQLRPPEYMYGVLARYLSAGADVVGVLAEDNTRFQQKVKSFKAWQGRRSKLLPPNMPSGDDLFGAIGAYLPSAVAIEECQAIIAQHLYYSGAGDWSGRAGAPIVEAFNRQLWETVADPGNPHYSAAFRLFALVTGSTFGAGAGADPDRRQATTLSIICDLALNPPLGFDAEGLPAAGGWHDVHPSLRFAALCQACTRVARRDWPTHDSIDAAAYRRFCATLLGLSGMRIAEPQELIRLIELTTDTYLARGYYPLKKSLWIYRDASLRGFELIDRHPRLLTDPWGEMAASGGEPATADPFFDPPFLIIEGQPQGDSLSEADYFTHVYGWSIARIVRATTLGHGAVSFAGLPGGDTSAILRQGAQEWFAETFLGATRS